MTTLSIVTPVKSDATQHFEDTAKSVENLRDSSPYLVEWGQPLVVVAV